MPRLLEKLKAAHLEKVTRQEQEARAPEAEEQARRIQEQEQEPEVRRILIGHITESGLIERLLDAKTFMEEQGYSPEVTYREKKGYYIPYQKETFPQDFEIFFNLSTNRRSATLILQWKEEVEYLRKCIVVSIDEAGEVSIGFGRRKSEVGIKSRDVRISEQEWKVNPDLLDEGFISAIQDPYIYKEILYKESNGGW